jgi:hypothetical protein
MAHDQEVMGSNPGTVYWMDLSHLLAITLKKLKIKVAKWGTPKEKKIRWLMIVFFKLAWIHLNISYAEVYKD